MKHIALGLFGILVFAACSDNAPQENTTAGDSTSTSMMTLGGEAPDSAFISKDTANKMIRSYLTSIDASENDSSLRSLIIDANSLRTYLNQSPDGRTITQMKVMFAHTQSYINAGNSGKNCGYKSGALTIVLAGFDSAGNYVFHPGNTVMDMAAPCPSSCPAVGTAAKDDIE